MRSLTEFLLYTFIIQQLTFSTYTTFELNGSISY